MILSFYKGNWNSPPHITFSLTAHVWGGEPVKQESGNYCGSGQGTRSFARAKMYCPGG
jgi:hypothetical protein